jgi:hypothetical protein
MQPVVASRAGNTEKIIFTFIIMACVLFHACKKTDGPPKPPPPVEPQTKVGKLKEKIVQNLPNPFYHFDYTDKGVVTGIEFASGLYIYQLSYANNRLAKMVNAFNGNTMVYNYINGRVASIRDIRPDGIVLWNYSFEYLPNNQLKEVRWYRMTLAGADSTLLRKVTLAYHADGNLAFFDDFRNDTGQLEWAQKMSYSNYDQEQNVDDFSILKDFFDNLLYLPGVRLQKNNARTELINGTQNDYEFTNTFQYQNGKPTLKSVRIVQTRGNQVGNLGDFTTTYSYY